MSYKWNKTDISHNTLLLIFMIISAFGVIVYIIYDSFSSIKQVFTHETQTHIEQIIDNSQTARTLSKSFSDITLLSTTFTDNNELLDREASRLSLSLEAISDQNKQAYLRQSIINLSRHFSDFLAKCREVNTNLSETKLITEKIYSDIYALENLLSQSLIDDTLKGEDTSFTDQLISLVIGYRESLLIIDKHHIDLKNSYTQEVSTHNNKLIIDAFDNLYLSLQTITTSAPVISDYGNSISQSVIQYKNKTVEMVKLQSELKALLTRLEKAKNHVLATIVQLDQAIANKSNQIIDGIETTINSSWLYVLWLSSLIIFIIVLGTYALVNKITRAYQLLQENKTQLQKLAMVVDQNPDSIVITNNKAEIEYVNQAFVKKTGYSIAEVLGKNPKLISSGKNSSSIYKNMWDDITQGKIWEGEFINTTKGGADYIEYAMIIPLKLSKDQITHYVAIKNDVTEKKQLEQELENHRLHLEDLVTKRTTELEEANAAKSQFLANMSHEIRTPLNGVLGIGQLLQDTPLNDEQASLLETMTNSGHMLITIINDILDYSKIDSGSIQFEQVSFNMESIIEEVIRLLNSSAIQKNNKIIFLNDEKRWSLLGDTVRITQVLTNLIGNAIKFTENGTITISSVVNEEIGKAVHFTIAIIDTGIGISQEQQDTIFDTFSQADASTTRRYGGTGLGLTISKKLIQLMGGELQVQSELGKGSEFSFSLTLNKDHKDIKKKRRKTDDNSQIQPGKILLVEDDKVNQLIAMKMLKKFNCEVTLARNGEEAVNIFSDNTFDLVLMDIQMPVMNGIDAAKLIRNNDKTTTIIALTANVMKDDKEKCFQAGMNDFISKPIQIDNLAMMLRKWL